MRRLLSCCVGLCLIVLAAPHLDADAIMLENGDVLRGRVLEQGDVIVFEHPQLGQIEIPADGVIDVHVAASASPEAVTPAMQPVSIVGGRRLGVGSLQLDAAQPATTTGACPPDPCEPEPCPPDPCAPEACDPCKSPWSAEATLAFGLSAGNSETLDLRLDGLVAYERGPWKAEAGGLFWYAEDDGRTTTEKLGGSLRIERQLGGSTYVFGQLLYDRDKPAGLQHRFAVTAGLGRTLWKARHQELTGEIGGGFTHERRFGVSPRTDPSGWLGLDYTYENPDGGPKVIASYDFLPNFADFDLSLHTVDVRLEQALNDTISLSFGVHLDYVVDPPTPGTRSWDLLTSIGLKFDF